MSFTGVKSLALALGNNQGNYRENLDTSQEDVKEAMSRRKPLLKCACDLRYCNQNFCMTEGVCFASARRKTKQKGKKPGIENVMKGKFYSDILLFI